MSAADELLKQRRAELARKFLNRSHEDASRFREVLDGTRAGNVFPEAAAFKHFAHRIHGTGATLGFESLSSAAAEFESLLVPIGAEQILAEPALQELRRAAYVLLERIEELARVNR
jgi:HPt (histidine-containing phosphotransfer) domain-containing protein